MISSLLFKVKSQYEPFAPSSSPIIRGSDEKAFTLSVVTVIDFVISESPKNRTTILLDSQGLTVEIRILVYQTACVQEY